MKDIANFLQKLNRASWACVDTIQLDFDNQWLSFANLRHTIITPNNSTQGQGFMQQSLV